MEDQTPILNYQAKRTRIKYPSDAIRVAIVFAGSAFGAGMLFTLMACVKPRDPVMTCGLVSEDHALGNLAFELACASIFAGAVLFISMKLREQFCDRQLFAPGVSVVITAACACFAPGFFAYMADAPDGAFDIICTICLLLPILAAFCVITPVAPPPWLRD